MWTRSVQAGSGLPFHLTAVYARETSRPAYGRTTKQLIILHVYNHYSTYNLLINSLFCKWTLNQYRECIIIKSSGDKGGSASIADAAVAHGLCSDGQCVNPSTFTSDPSASSLWSQQCACTSAGFLLSADRPPWIPLGGWRRQWVHVVSPAAG